MALHTFQITNTSPYSPEQMFAIAADIERYPEFIKLIRAVRVSERGRDEHGRETFRGEIDIVYDKLNIHQTFASHVTLDLAGLTIHSVSNQKPMKHLDSRWQFRPLPEGGSAIEYDVKYEMSNKVLQFVVNKSFDYAMRRVVDAFERQAKRVYGRPAKARRRQAV
jgi:coenzyme Q-binding protein COQ10